MPAQKRDPRRNGLPYALNLRVGDVHYRGLALVAEASDSGLAEITREAIEQYLRSLQMTGGPHAGKSMLQALEDDPNLTGYPELSEHAVPDA